MPLAASALDLLRKALYFSSPLPYSMESRRQASSAVEEEEQSSFTFSAVLKAVPSLQGRTLVATPRRTVPPSKLELFFETLVNLPSVSEDSDNALKNRPRLIYIRDFPTLAPSSSVWYPPLLAAIRNRRKGPISRPSSVVAFPTTIIFGMSSSIVPPNSPGSTGNLFDARNTSPSEVAGSGKSENVNDWSESEAAQLARYERLSMKAKKWHRDADAVYDECPKLSAKQESKHGGSLKPEVFVIGWPSSSPLNLPPLLSMPVQIESRESDGDTSSQFFRFSVLFPRSPSSSQLRDTRINRRREINELLVRMEIGAVGGVLGPRPAELALTIVTPGSETLETQPSSPLGMMWESWGNEIEAWQNVRIIADRAMGSVMALHHLSGKKATLESTLVPWTALQTAWAHESSREKGDDLAMDQQEDPSKTELGNDKVVESIKNDPDLDPHEHRLISCIVDPSTLSG